MKLKEFIDKYSDGIAEVIEERLNPVYNPLKPEGVEEYEAKMPELLRVPFPVQGEVIKAISKALYHQKREKLFIVGEMGVGKTLLALSTIFMSPVPMRSLVVCPTHLVDKWIREAKHTIPDAVVIDLCVKGIISILEKLRYERSKPKSHEVYVISKERLKLSYAWRGAAAKKKGSKFPHCPRCGEVAMHKRDKYVTFEDLHNKKILCKCKEPLWQADQKLRRYAAGEFIKKHLKGFFDICVLDEIQDYKAGESLQGRSMGSLTSAVKKCLCLTGTLNSGYADDLFYLLYRTDAKAIKDSGFSYHSSEKWLETFGTLERVQKIENKDNYYGRGKKKGEMVRKRPGVSPAVVGRYLLDKSVFVRLADVIEGLPPYEEIVIAVKGDNDQMKLYDTLEAKLRKAVKAYKTKALAAMLQALLSYPDSCVSFPENIEIKDRQTGKVLEVIRSPMLEIEKDKLLPKEQELVDLVRVERAQGRKVLCYLTFTDSRDIRPRLRSILEKEGFKVGVLNASVEPKKREAWVRNNTRDIDVLLVNAELVKTGLDLYEFPTVVFYQIGYNIFTLRQAARRSWRIGQTQPVKVIFLCYQDTIQELALTLIAKKLEVALLVEGDLPEGLAEYTADDTSLANEIAKSLMEGTKTASAEAAWANFRKKEVESQLGLCRNETIFTETAKGKPAKKTLTDKTSISENVVIKISLIETGKKKQSTLEIKYGEIDSLLSGKIAQFCMF